MRSLLVLLLDGLGDRAHPGHGGRTANEAANTPNLDALAARGSTGLLSPLGPGRAPSSEVAHWAILGYPPAEFPGRAVLEARGHGHSPAAGEVLAHAALRTTERRDGAIWVTGRAGPGDAADARVLLESIPRRTAGALGMEVRPLVPERGEGVLVVTGGAHDGVTDSDPFFRDRLPMLRPRPLASEAAATARAAELWSRATLRALERHPVNAARRRRDRPPLGAVTLKWWGRPREAPFLPRAPRPRRRPDRRLALPRRAGGDHGPAVRALRRGRRPGRRPARAARPGPDGPRRGRHLRVLPPEGDRRGRPHQGPGRKATHDRGRRRGARGPRRPLRRRDRLRHRRPRHADLARGHPLGGPGPVPAGRARRPRRSGRALRGARLRRRPARAPGRGGRDARAAERRRPAALPGLAPHPGARRPPASRPTSSPCGPRRPCRPR